MNLERDDINVIDRSKPSFATALDLHPDNLDQHTIARHDVMSVNHCRKMYKSDARSPT
jgi:hypothetical protein